MRKITAGLAALAATAVLGAGATASFAAKTGDATGTVTCSNGVKAKLKAGVRNSLTQPTVPNALIKVQLDVDDRAAGVWSATANGAAMPVVTAGSAANGFNTEFILFIRNGAGPDKIDVTATTGAKTCTGSVTVAG